MAAARIAQGPSAKCNFAGRGSNQQQSCSSSGSAARWLAQPILRGPTKEGASCARANYAPCCHPSCLGYEGLSLKSLLCHGGIAWESAWAHAPCLAGAAQPLLLYPKAACGKVDEEMRREKKEEMANEKPPSREENALSTEIFIWAKQKEAREDVGEFCSWASCVDSFPAGVVRCCQQGCASQMLAECKGKGQLCFLSSPSLILALPRGWR